MLTAGNISPSIQFFMVPSVFDGERFNPNPRSNYV